MATLTNTQISVTYVGLLKTSANTVLTSTAQQITDGSGNNSIMFLSTAGVGIGAAAASGKELDVTGNVLVTGDLIVDNITIDGSTITNASGNLTIVNTVDDGDVILQSDDGSGGTTAYLTLDGSTTTIVASKNITLADDLEVIFGTGNDLKIFHSGGQTELENYTGNLVLQQHADDADISFQCDNGSGGVTEYFRCNGDNSDIIVSKPIELEDGVELRIGSSGADLRFFHSTNSFMQNFVGDLQIEQHTDDKDIFFRCDDGSGSVTTYILLDGSEVATKIETVKIFMSNLPTSNPSVAGQLYNDSGTLKISAG
tara:strand:- start:13373 stop:14311 length:939 start_codon:yes stop_codon:yes gene_type:complete